MNEKKVIPFWKDCLMQIGAGGAAGLTEILLMHPLDVVKTRLQVQKENKYTSISGCFRSIIKNEGFFAIYKGIIPPIFAETPKRATKFFMFEQYKNIFRFGSKENTASSLALAGMFAGLTEAIVVNPFEVVKVKLQTDENKFTKQKSTFAVAREIYTKDGFGLKGLNRGLTATMGRHGVWNCVYFGFYHNVKVFIPKSSSKSQDYMYRSSAGFVAGTLASIINIPWDVAKSRIQGERPIAENQRKYKSCVQTMLLVNREEGFKALYKGLTPKVMRLGPGGAIMIVVYEELYEYFKVKF